MLILRFELPRVVTVASDLYRFALFHAPIGNATGGSDAWNSASQCKSAIARACADVQCIHSTSARARIIGRSLNASTYHIYYSTDAHLGLIHFLSDLLSGKETHTLGFFVRVLFPLYYHKTLKSHKQPTSNNFTADSALPKDFNSVKHVSSHVGVGPNRGPCRGCYKERALWGTADAYRKRWCCSTRDVGDPDGCGVIRAIERSRQKCEGQIMTCYMWSTNAATHVHGSVHFANCVPVSGPLTMLLLVTTEIRSLS